MPYNSCHKCKQCGGSPASRLVMTCINDNREKSIRTKNSETLKVPGGLFYKTSGGAKKRSLKKRHLSKQSKKRQSSKKKK